MEGKAARIAAEVRAYIAALVAKGRNQAENVGVLGKRQRTEAVSALSLSPDLVTLCARLGSAATFAAMCATCTTN